MSAPPDLFNGADLIPHISSTPTSSGFNSPSRPDSSSPSPPDPEGAALERSRTAPPPGSFVDDQIVSSSPRASNDDPGRRSPEDHHATAGPSKETSPPLTSALRRTLSNESTPGSRDKKRLRFTTLADTPTPKINNALGLRDPILVYPSTPFQALEEGKAHWGRGSRGVPRDQLDYLRSDPGTPNLSETADQIRRTLSLASLDNLLALSVNASGERDKLLAEVSKAGKDLVWRPDDEERLFPRDGERAVILAAKRGIRSFILAFSTRAGVNVLLMLFRTFRRRRLKIAMIRHAIFGAEPFRFGAMIGTFTFLNTLTLHLLRLAPPLSYIRRRLKAGLFVTPTFGPPEREGDEGERRWQAAVAGAVGSLGLLWEAHSRRAGVAQQLFVRGLQASYNQYTPHFGIHVPHGDLLVFGLCCGQIMFAWLVSPETMPKEYNAWILSASRAPSYAVEANRTITRKGFMDPGAVQKALAHPHVTPHNATLLQIMAEKMRGGWQPVAVPHEIMHPWVDTCADTNIRRFFAVFRFMLPVYSALHIIPALVLRRHHVRRAPLRMLAKIVWGITRSCSFLGVFVFIYQSLMCARTEALDRVTQGNLLSTLLKRKETFWMIGFSTCLSLLVEEKKRRAELAMYVLPRALESAWSSARRRAWVPLVPFGETILGAAAMAMVMDSYKHSPEAMSGILRKLLYQLVGPV